MAQKNHPKCLYFWGGGCHHSSVRLILGNLNWNQIPDCGGSVDMEAKEIMAVKRVYCPCLHLFLFQCFLKTLLCLRFWLLLVLQDAVGVDLHCPTCVLESGDDACCC